MDDLALRFLVTQCSLIIYIYIPLSNQLIVVTSQIFWNAGYPPNMAQIRAGERLKRSQ